VCSPTDTHIQEVNRSDEHMISTKADHLDLTAELSEVEKQR
jgi:hypothetical protein